MTEPANNVVAATISKMSKVADPDIRDATQMKPQQGVRQGDIYIVKVTSLEQREEAYDARTDDIPRSKLGKQTTNRQLADGTTQGSRHILEPKANTKLEIWDPAQGADPLESKTFRADGPFTLTHPEHAHFEFGPGTYVAFHQRDWASEERARVYD